MILTVRRSFSLGSSQFPSLVVPFLNRRRFTITAAIPESLQTSEELLVVVGGGAAGIYGAIRAKTLAPNLGVLVIEKAKPLSKVKISGGGRCNVTNGHCADQMVLAGHYPRGNKELRGTFFDTHGPMDTMSWFSDHGVQLKTEEDGRVFPVSNSSSTIIDCLLHEAKRIGGTVYENEKFVPPWSPPNGALKNRSGRYIHPDVALQTGKVVTSASTTSCQKFRLKIEKRTIDLVELIDADYLMIASGSSRQGYSLAIELGHSIVDPVPSLFTFKIEDKQLAELSGITFPRVKVKLKLENLRRNIPQLTQVGPMLVTHWGLSGPAILRLSAWGARELFGSDYRGTLIVDFIPDFNVEDAKSILLQHKDRFPKQKILNSFPPEFDLVKRFWKYILEREGLDGDTFWASISNNSLLSVSSLLKQCPFAVKGKGQFKDEFVTAGGVPLSEISLHTMESKIQPRLYFAGEVLNIDGVTGGFNFQNAWSGGYIAGTSIGKQASNVPLIDKIT